MIRPILYCLIFVSAVLLVESCKIPHFRNDYQDATALFYKTEGESPRPYLKAHMKNGTLYVLADQWKIDTSTHRVIGTGQLYGLNRNLVSTGPVQISIDSVAIFETNTKIKNAEAPFIAGLSILAGLDVALGVICLTVPKACYGSCPTFYINEHDNFRYADAEGFSNAIAPSLEYADVDALNYTAFGNDSFCITMKNEALETHCIQDIQLLAFPIAPGEAVAQTPRQTYFLCKKEFPLTKAMGPEGEITSLLNKADRIERFSLADTENMSSKEEIILTFDHTEGVQSLGLRLDFRQTLMTTYLIYSAMGYMGDEVGDMFARIENGGDTRDKLRNGIKKELGNIDVYLWNERTGNWDFKEGFYETGPIAINRQLIALDKKTGTEQTKVKLILNKGLWRIDYAALTHLIKPISPLTILPNKITIDGKVNTVAYAKLSSTTEHLISMPGDKYKLHFKMPDSKQGYSLFLYSKGYYLEWMRAHWIKDKDLLKLRQMVYQPRKYLRSEAAKYKSYEATMEEQFWNSKVETQLFTLYEN